MANLSIRKLDEDVLIKLRNLAAANGVSMEEEVRQILKQAVSQHLKLGDMAVQLFGETAGVELEMLKQPAHEPMDFSL
ncbi:MAG: Arc family DNA-binding protein [Methylococcaceae bacterium]|nr:Arc family DNA-binding protein [Methylococcaceae bacterium]